MRKLILKNREIASVCVKTGETAPEQYAGREFLRYMGLFGIPAGDGLTVDIHIDPELAEEGFRIHVENDEKLEITGGSGRGAIYGVYRFLERYAGVRYFTPTLETLGDGDIVVDEDFAFAPVFEYRSNDGVWLDDADWSVKNGINFRPIPEEKGGNIRYGLPAHSMEMLTGADQCKEQPCLSDPENVKKAIANLRKVIQENPKARIFSVSQNDNNNYCKCEKCAAIDAEEGSQSGSLIRFVNAVAADIAQDYPDVIIHTLAYHYTRKAPKITKPLPNVCIQLCSIECCFMHPLDDCTCAKNSNFYTDIVEWGKMSDRLYIWDYVINFANYLITFPNFHILRENMRFYAEHGAKGMYPEGNYHSNASGEFGELRGYLLAQLMWNPYMSTTEYYRHMDEFLAAFYGKGWRYIRAYIDILCMEAVGGHSGCKEKPFDIIPKEKWLALEDTITILWDKAEEMAGDRLEAVQRSRIQWRYAQQYMHPGEESAKKLIEDVTAYDMKWYEYGDPAWGVPKPGKLHLEPWDWFRN